MSGEVFTDASMLEIFRAEVETHVESMTSGLLALERDPEDTTHIDEMMRGAHSIKGAARIVGIEPAVRVAHVMEDGFVAAQNGKLNLRPDHVDVLLRGVDMLNRLASSSNDPAVDWTQFDREVTPLVAEITAALAGQSAPSAPPPDQESPASFAPPSASKMTPIDQGKTTDQGMTIPFPPMLDAAAAELIRQAFIKGLVSPVSLIRFDLSNMLDLDATGLALLAAVPTNVIVGKRVELAGISADIEVVLRATGVDRLYPAGGR